MTPDIPIETIDQPEDLLQQIFRQLRQHTGHDFSNYKRPTLLRRINRRMQFNNIPDLPAYVSFIEQHPNEINNLLKDLLISVTQFFRDESSFDQLAQVVMPIIFQGKKPGQPIRIWVAGCATGEEAYSIAILCAEQAALLKKAPPVQIMATDIDEHALAIARQAFYPANELAHLSAERLQRFFVPKEEGYEVQAFLKKQVQFIHQNFLQTIPAISFDFISCRNVFIYLNYTAQEQVLKNFQAAIKPNGFLFLGKAESINGAPQSFATFNREHQIYQFTGNKSS